MRGKKLFTAIANHLKPRGILAFCDIQPSGGVRLSEILTTCGLDPERVRQLKQAEDLIYSDQSNPLVNWDGKTVIELLTETGFSNIHSENIAHDFKISITEAYP